MNTDRTFYAAFNHYPTGDEAIVDPSMTRAELVKNIRRGELGFDNVVKVLAFNPVEHICDDVTDEVFALVEAEVRRLQDIEDFPLSRHLDAAE
jgi:hypothetical protein